MGFEFIDNKIDRVEDILVQFCVTILIKYFILMFGNSLTD